MSGTDRQHPLARALTFRLQKPSYVELVFALVLIWGFGDALSTLFAARFAGAHLEANPWIRLLLHHQPMAVILLKGATVLYVGIVLLECRRFVTSLPWWRAWLLAVVSAGALVVLGNVYVGLVAAAP
jgi:hypothetical protein